MHTWRQAHLHSFSMPPSPMAISGDRITGFIEKGMIDHYGLKVTTLNQPIPVFNPDGGRNKLGDITGYVSLEMSIGDHKEIMWLHTTSLDQECIFIGQDWLWKHNPNINWKSSEVAMSQCSKKTCGYEYCQKRGLYSPPPILHQSAWTITEYDRVW